MNKNLLKLVATCFVLLFSISFGITLVYADSNNLRQSEIVGVRENDISSDVKSVVEEFIPKNLSFMFSSDDYSLIDTNSKKYLEFLKLRNDYRKKTLNSTGIKEQDLEYVNYSDFQYKNIRKLDENMLELSVSAKKTTKYKDDDIVGTSVFNYIIRLHKVDDLWKVWSASSDDEITNPFDSKKKIDIIQIAGIPDEDFRLNKVDDDIHKMKLFYNSEMENYFNQNNNYENGKLLNQDVKYIRNVELKATNGYVNRDAMYNYMMKYAHNYNDDYEVFAYDCANFGSQILFEGGASTGGGAIMDGQFRLWDTKNGPKNSKNYGHAWTVAKYLRGYIIRNTSNIGPRGHVISYGSKLKKGDFCFLDLYKDGGISHTTIVSTPGPNFRICSHTNDRCNERINDVHPAGKNGDYRSYVTLTDLY